MEWFNVKLTLLTTELSATTVYFFQCCGADMGITASCVLNRLLLKISEKTPVLAAKLTMWYFNALTARKNTEEKLDILNVFAVLCLALFDDDAVLQYEKLNPRENNYMSVDFHFDHTIKFALANDTATALNQKIEEYKLSEGETIDRIVDEFTSKNNETIPYILMNYLFVSARRLIRPQARTAVQLALLYSIDDICELSDCIKENVIDIIKHMRDYSFTNQNVLENINVIKNSGFYKTKFLNNGIL